MRVSSNTTAKLRMAAVVVLGGLSLSACATNYDAAIADLNNRVAAVDAKANDALQRADAANATAQAAAADAHNANARLDQLTTRVDTLQQQQSMARQPRG